jgi:hypothetical protein
MRRLDLLHSGRICNRPGQLQNPVVGSCAQLHPLHGGFEQVGAGFINRAEFADFSGPHI